MVRDLRHKGHLITGLFIASTIAVILSLSSHFNLLHGFQLRLSDSLFEAASYNLKEEPEDDIVIVAIDDYSLNKLGNFSSWPRTYHAQLVDMLSDAGARVIAFDILFAEPAAGDEELSAAIDNAGNVILPFVYHVASQEASAVAGLNLTDNTLRPVDYLENGALALGHALMIPDDDGITRRIPLIACHEGNCEPSLALSTVSKYLRRPTIIESPIVNGNLEFAGRSIPLDDSGSMLINFTDRSSLPLNFKFISYADALYNHELAAEFHDKIVVVGVTATALGDRFWTPMGQLTSGVELHASAIQTILTGNFIYQSSHALDIITIIIMVGLCSLAILLLRVLWAALVTVFLGVCYILVTFTLFDSGVMMNLLYPLLALAATFAFMSIYNVAYERAEKNEIIKTFGRYTFPPLVERILKASKEDRLKLGGNTQEVTVMFVDARNFTGISEKMPSSDVVDAMNAYFREIIDIVRKYGGMVGNFGGDSIMATWNVPVETVDHARLATEAAMAIQHAIHKIHQEDSPPLILEFGIGINTGEAVAGNMGAESYLQYSVIGDSVNVAARLATDVPGGRIWIGERTLEKAEDSVEAVALAPLVVKGRDEPVKAYEVCRNSDDTDAEFCSLSKIPGGNETNEQS